MPSSDNYVRDYKQEYKTAKDRGEQGTGSDSGSAKRGRARRKAVKMGLVRPGDGKDLDHSVPISKGGSNSTKNFRVRSKHANRSFPRNSDGSMKANHPKE